MMAMAAPRRSSASSKKTRIETKCLPSGAIGEKEVRAPVPRKQGLKLAAPLHGLFRPLGSSASSKKTRIETDSSGTPTTYNLKGSSASSKKTRIETKLHSSRA